MCQIVMNPAKRLGEGGGMSKHGHVRRQFETQVVQAAAWSALCPEDSAKVLKQK
jgi:hypothetical protein